MGHVALWTGTVVKVLRAVKGMTTTIACGVSKVRTRCVKNWSTDSILHHRTMDGRSEGRVGGHWSAIMCRRTWQCGHITPQEVDWVGYTEAHPEDPGSTPGGGIQSDRHIFFVKVIFTPIVP